MLQFIGTEKYLIALIVGIMFVFTIIVCILYSDRFLRPQLFKDEEFRMNPEYIKKWTEMYSQHIHASPIEMSNSFDVIDKQIEQAVVRMKKGSLLPKINK